jgi:acid phosphatase
MARTLARIAAAPLTAALLLALLAGCETLPSHVVATPAAPPASAPVRSDEVIPPAAPAGPVANDNLNAVAWMQTAIEYRLITGQTFRAALAQLDRALKTPGWDALAKPDRPGVAAGLPPAIIVDIDETMLDNSPAQARLVRDNEAFSEARWDEWVQSQAARPLPGALEFARAAAARGVTIYYVSNRTVAQGPATLANLRKAGFPLRDDTQYLGLGTVVPGCEGSGSDKGCRRQLVGRTHRVLMQFGDQLGDFVSIPVNTLAGREQAIRPYLGWVGERWFVLPNPSYGSWEPALFDNAWGKPAPERRADKLGALRY